MVKVKEKDYIQPDGTIDIQTWLHDVAERRMASVKLIGQACHLAQITGGDQALLTGKTCLQRGLNMAELLLELRVDQETIAAAILYNNVEYADLTLEDVAEQVGPGVAKLILGAQQMEAIRSLLSEDRHHKEQSNTQIDNLRKMLLAMVEDVRVVLIKLAEKTCVTRSAAKLDPVLRKRIARETKNIYAPLANRLGIWHIKWELEDLSLRFLEPEAYKEVAQKLAVRRVDRDRYIEEIKTILKDLIAQAGVEKFEISGRAKHIYSIYRKMQRKDVDYNEIYDVSAVRVLVPTVEDCYAVLGCVQNKWETIPEEFDDYISNPKPNGYRSLHTAVIGPNQQSLEVQIRTFEMHQESELGVAAHWKYKEGRRSHSDYEEKIAWLRQILDWQQELSSKGEPLEQAGKQKIFDDRVYIFTPQGEIVDLPQGATPLDFAYHIHSEVGNHCRGAKVNGNMVPFSYQLKTGERVEIQTSSNITPSRDWLNPTSGYIKTARARAKIHHWFKQQDHERLVNEGHNTLEKELRRLGTGYIDQKIDYDQVAKKLNLRSSNDVFLSLGNSDIKIGQVISAIESILNIKKELPEQVYDPKPAKLAAQPAREDIRIEGLGGLLSYHARCCKPVPGDPIVGFITKGRGISIHQQDCKNIVNTKFKERLIDVNWSDSTAESYPVDLSIVATERQGLIRDVVAVVTNEKVQLLGINTRTDEMKNLTFIAVTVSVSNIENLQSLINKFTQIPDVSSVTREAEGKTT